MKQRLLSITVILLLVVGNSMAQRLAVSRVEKIPGGIGINVEIEGATQMNAIQFALELPEGYFFNVKDAYPLGSATCWHRQVVHCIDSGDLQVIIYSMNPYCFTKKLTKNITTSILNIPYITVYFPCVNICCKHKIKG